MLLHRSRPIRFGGALVLLLVAGAQAREAEGIVLRLKAMKGPQTFVVQTREEISTLGADGTERRNLFESTRTFEKLAVTTKAKDVFFTSRKGKSYRKLNGRMLAGLAEPEVDTYEILSPRGERRTPHARHSPGEEIFPVLPEGRVSPGFEWGRTIPGTDAFSLPVTVKNHFQGVRTVDGRDCAIIHSLATCQGQERRSGEFLQSHLLTIYSLALREGDVVRTRSVGEVLRAPSAPRPDGATRIRRRIFKRVELLDEK